jgi:hypothetical protein
MYNYEDLKNGKNCYFDRLNITMLEKHSQQERYSMVCYLWDNHVYKYEDLNKWGKLRLWPFKHYNDRKPYSQQERYSTVCIFCKIHVYNYEDLKNWKNWDSYRLNTTMLGNHIRSKNVIVWSAILHQIISPIALMETLIKSAPAFPKETTLPLPMSKDSVHLLTRLCEKGH